MRIGKPAILILALMGALALCGCRKHANSRTLPSLKGADPAHGAQLIDHYGCSACHTIPGIPDAQGVVGPPLTQFARRIYIAGMLRNNPDNLEHWIREPQSVVPGNAMPQMNVTKADAKDIAAYLYTLH